MLPPSTLSLAVGTPKAPTLKSLEAVKHGDLFGFESEEEKEESTFSIKKPRVAFR